MDLDDETIERIARRVAELLSAEREGRADAPARPVRLVDAATLAARLGVRREWVYRHARQLGAVRLGGPRGRLRFDLDLALSQRPSEPGAGGAGGSGAGGRSSGLGVTDRSTYSRKDCTTRGRAGRHRSRPDTGNRGHPMQHHRGAGGR